MPESPPIPPGLDFPAYLKWYGEMILKMLLDYAEQAVKFLILINAGAIVATLSFMSAEPKIRTMTFVWDALTCFLVGIVLVGVLFAAQIFAALDVIRRFGRSTKKVIAGTPIHLAFKPPAWYVYATAIPICLGLGALGCFIGGSWAAVRGLRHELIPSPPAVVRPLPSVPKK